MKLISTANSLNKWIVGFTVSLSGLLALTACDSQEIFLESQESKTFNDAPVFNKIKWFQFKDKDVWMMNQSHHGATATADKWDRIAIVVDKTKSPHTVRYFQFEPGLLEWSESIQERTFKVSCFMCHANGPRAIRPNYGSTLNPMAWTDRLKVAYWNVRIKMYGRVVIDPIHDELDKIAKRPLRRHSAYENESLKVATCVICHKESGFLARGELTRQQVPTIKFMVESGHMPPFGLSLSAKEKQELDKFLAGF